MDDFAAELDTRLAQQALNTNKDRFAGDENLFVQFSIEAQLNSSRSRVEGRPIYEDKEYVQIMSPGNKDGIVKRPVRDIDRVRFPKHYAAFKQGNEQQVDGTPLDELPGITKSEVAMFAVEGVRTVEQIVGMSDTNAQRFMAFSQLRARAQNWLDKVAENEPMERLQQALESRDNKISTLEVAIKDMAEKIGKLEVASG